jgi:CAAX prenyl protease-like protein
MIPYTLPFFLYLLLSQVPPAFPQSYSWLYPVVVLVVGSVAAGLLHGRQLLRPHRDVLPGVAVGLAGIAVWIVLCHLDLESSLRAFLPAWLRPAERASFNPFERIGDPFARCVFIVIRVIGLVVLVPVVEELFWRGFLIRWLISPNWQQQKPGQFTWFSFAAVTLLFALAHREWLAAAVYGGLLNGLWYWKRDLWNCVVAHAISNLVLAGYILATGNWQLW